MTRVAIAMTLAAMATAVSAFPTPSEPGPVRLFPSFQAVPAEASAGSNEAEARNDEGRNEISSPSQGEGAVGFRAGRDLDHLTTSTSGERAISRVSEGGGSREPASSGAVTAPSPSEVSGDVLPTRSLGASEPPPLSLTPSESSGEPEKLGEFDAVELQPRPEMPAVPVAAKKIPSASSSEPPEMFGEFEVVQLQPRPQMPAGPAAAKRVSQQTLPPSGTSKRGPVNGPPTFSVFPAVPEPGEHDTATPLRTAVSAEDIIAASSSSDSLRAPNRGSKPRQQSGSFPVSAKTPGSPRHSGSRSGPTPTVPIPGPVESGLARPARIARNRPARAPANVPQPGPNMVHHPVHEGVPEAQRRPRVKATAPTTQDPLPDAPEDVVLPITRRSPNLGISMDVLSSSKRTEHVTPASGSAGGKVDEQTPLDDWTLASLDVVSDHAGHDPSDSDQEDALRRFVVMTQQNSSGTAASYTAALFAILTYLYLILC